MDLDDTDVKDVSNGPSGDGRPYIYGELAYDARLQRQYGVLSIISTALVVDSAWIGLGGTLVVASANGGPPGIIYEFLAACFYYAFINASLAELASSVPSSAGVYHYTYLTAGPRLGPALGYLAGTLNFSGWLLGSASICMIAASAATEIYAILHPALTIEGWHIYVAFVAIVCGSCLFIIFCNRLLPALQNIGLCLVVGGGIVTVVVVAVMPQRHASSSFVWKTWSNTTGWPDGVAFLSGMLNGAYSVGTGDAITHMTEEMPHPRKDVPKAMAAQLLLGLFTGFVFLVAIMYGVTDFNTVLASNPNFPLAGLYAQATGNRAATIALLLIVLLVMIICGIGCFVTTGRTLWTLARDNAVPFSHVLEKASVKWSCPTQATLCVCSLALAFGALRLGSVTAFNDLVGSFVILTTMSFALAFSSHLLSGRSRLPIGPFWMGKWGYLVNGMAIVFILVTNIFYCLPYFLPVGAPTMNYNVVILVGWMIVIAVWWFSYGSSRYRGPKIGRLENGIITDT